MQPSPSESEAETAPPPWKYDRSRRRSTVKTFATFIYNKKKRTICRRSLKNWAILIVFYLVLLGFLFGLFFGMLMAILKLLQTNRMGPLFSKADLLDEPSPALTVFPRVPAANAPIIWYTRKGEPSKHLVHPSYFAEEIEDFLKPYTKLSPKARYVDCNKMRKERREGMYCLFQTKDLGPCGDPSTQYGYAIDAPCVYLKLNMIEGWKPSRVRKKLYILKEADDLDMYLAPINGTDLLFRNSSDMFSIDTIGVHCEGKTSFDHQHMGNLSFNPWGGFKEKFFPYDGSQDYLRPLIGIQFHNLTRGLLIGVKCSIFDIENMKDPLLHSVTFYVFIDND